MLLCPTCGAAYRENGLNCPRDGARLAPAIDLDPRLGSQVGNYRLIDLLGKGGMGVVYSAQHTFIPKRVAIKILDERFAKVPELVTRFFQEAVAAATIGHPSIILIDDVGELPGGTAYIVMEYVDGRPLDQVIDEDGPMQLGRALHIEKQIASALAAAHEKNIIHRDLKPANIMLSKPSGNTQMAMARTAIPGGGADEKVKILDFGMAKMVDDPGARPTKPGMLLGTPQYMAPEAARGEPVDYRADIYALGVLLYEMLSGSPPFGGTLEKILQAHVHEPPPPMSQYNPSVDVTDRAESIIMRCLAKRPDERPRSMRELLAELKDADGPGAKRRAFTRSDPGKKQILPGSVDAKRLREELQKRTLESGEHDTLVSPPPPNAQNPQFLRTLKGVGNDPKKKPR
jgi:eukaryotic-like serine/threonine-protein kinase